MQPITIGLQEIQLFAINSDGISAISFYWIGIFQHFKTDYKRRGEISQIKIFNPNPKKTSHTT